MVVQNECAMSAGVKVGVFPDAGFGVLPHDDGLIGNCVFPVAGEDRMCLFDLLPEDS